MSARLERLVTMHDEIARGRFPSVHHFCSMFEVQPRTVYEDIRALKERLGMEVAFDRNKNGYYNKNPKKRLPSFELTQAEVLALTIGRDMLVHYTGTTFEPILKSALEKISERLPLHVSVHLDDVRSMIKFKNAFPIEIPRKLFINLSGACEESLSVYLKYFSAGRGELTDRTVEPQRLLEHRGVWYLIAFCRLREDLRLFALHRIRDYRVNLDDSFLPKDSGVIDEWLRSPLFLEHRGTEQFVKIRFQPDAGRYIRERQWHFEQLFTESDDGCCVLEFPTPSLEEVKRWVMTFGCNAEVIEPRELRDLVCSEVEKMVDLYL